MARTIDPQETIEGTTDTAAQNGSGWEVDTATQTTAAIGTGTACGSPGAAYKRHKWDGEICTHCGATKSSVTPERTPSTGKRTTSTRTTKASSQTIEMLAGLLWQGAGMGLEYLPTRAPFIGRLAEPVSRVNPDDPSQSIVTAPPSVAVGRVMQLESAIAGKRIDNALRGTPVGKFINALMNATGPWAEILPLFLPPLIVGAAAMYPEFAARFKGIMVAAMIPVLTEASKMAEQQAALMGQLEGVNAETVAQASALVDSLLGIKPSAS